MDGIRGEHRGALNVAANECDLAHIAGTPVQRPFHSRVVEGHAKRVGARQMPEQVDVDPAASALTRGQLNDDVAHQPDGHLGGVQHVFQVVDGAVRAWPLERDHQVAKPFGGQIRLTIAVALLHDFLNIVVSMDEDDDVAGRVDPAVGKRVGMILHFVYPFARRDLVLGVRQGTGAPSGSGSCLARRKTFRAAASGRR